jgi:ATP-dependent Clp protease protease subunit
MRPNDPRRRKFRTSRPAEKPEIPPAGTLASAEALRLDNEDDEETKELKVTRESPIMLDLLRKERTIIVSEEVTPRLTQRVVSSLLWLDAQGSDPIRLYVNTPGGSADDGFAIHDAIRFVRAPVYAICIGLNASAGTLILLGASRERRLGLPNARLMIHQPSGGGRGRASDIEITAEEILKLRQRANELISAETGRPFDKVEADTDRDFWLSAEEAVEYGLLSRVVKTLRDIF